MPHNSFLSLSRNLCFSTMEIFLLLVLFLAITGHSSATYCICKDGVDDSAMQKVIDYACGAGADCAPINQNGACYNPNTVKNHCNFAANSYFQRKGQATGTCEFAGSATTSVSIPTQSSGCVYQSSPSSSTTPSTPPPPSGTTPPSTTTPPPPSGTTPSTTTPPPPSTMTPSTIAPPPPPPSSIFGTGISPTGSSFGADSADRILLQNTNLIFPLAFTGFLGHHLRPLWA